MTAQCSSCEWCGEWCGERGARLGEDGRWTPWLVVELGFEVVLE